jgi:hypothetical protein
MSQIRRTEVTSGGYVSTVKVDDCWYETMLRGVDDPQADEPVRASTEAEAMRNHEAMVTARGGSNG